MKTKNELAKKTTEQSCSAITQRIIRLPDIEQMIGLKRSSIYNKINPKSAHYDLTFPKPIKLGARSIGWVESSIQEWIKLRRELGV